MCSQGVPRVSVYFHKVLQITRQTEFIHEFSINKEVVAVLLARFAVTFQHCEDILGHEPLRRFTASLPWPRCSLCTLNHQLQPERRGLSLNFSGTEVAGVIRTFTLSIIILCFQFSNNLEAGTGRALSSLKHPLNRAFVDAELECSPSMNLWWLCMNACSRSLVLSSVTAFCCFICQKQILFQETCYGFC